jgi:hypothetical protein
MASFTIVHKNGAQIVRSQRLEPIGADSLRSTHVRPSVQPVVHLLSGADTRVEALKSARALHEVVATLAWLSNQVLSSDLIDSSGTSVIQGAASFSPIEQHIRGAWGLPQPEPAQCAVA